METVVCPSGTMKRNETIVVMIAASLEKCSITHVVFMVARFCGCISIVSMVAGFMAVSMWNTTPGWNTTIQLVNNYLLKCPQHMLDVFSTENLSLHHKILIGIKNQFDLHKLL